VFAGEDEDGDLLEVGVGVEGGDRWLCVGGGRSNGKGWSLRGSLGIVGTRRERKNEGAEE
jgi:hypothetical protein